MGRSHLKVYLDFEDRAEALSDAEKGRLLLAMVRYARTGEAPALGGNERFVFPAFKAEIDRDIANYDQKVANGSKGGRPATKPNETENNLTKPKITENNLTKPKREDKEEDKEEDKDKDEDKGKESKEKSGRSLSLADGFDMFWAAYPRHTAKDVARKSWGRLNPSSELVTVILSAIERQKTSAQWTRDNGQYIPHPATWLNQHRWEDELPSAQPVNAFAAYVERMEREGIA